MIDPSSPMSSAPSVRIATPKNPSASRGASTACGTVLIVASAAARPPPAPSLRLGSRLRPNGSCSSDRRGLERVLVPERDAGELQARGDRELREHVAQVRVDRARREEQLRGDLLVGHPLGDEAGDLELLRRELVDGARLAL